MKPKIGPTAGPWVYHSGMIWKPDGSADGIPIARMDRDTPATTPTERDANARLIAQAPELVERLRAFLNAHDDCERLAARDGADPEWREAECSCNLCERAREVLDAALTDGKGVQAGDTSRQSPVAIAADVYELAVDNTESFETEDHIGADLAYLLGAIVRNQQVAWQSNNALLYILLEHAPPEHAVWSFITIESEDA